MKLMHIIFYIFSLVVINTLYAQDYIKLSGEALEKSPRTISEQLSQTQSNDVQNTGSASNPKLYPPKINQLGYLPKAEKKFTILADSIKPNDSFQIIDHSTSEIVFSGNLSNEEIDGETLHGETVLRGDFSSFENTGRYRVKVGRWESNPFSISVNVYNLLFLQAERTLYICRANTVLNDAITGINHNMGHPQDFDINGKDLSGGWYNAGDYGKWTHCAAITVAHLLWLFRLDSDAFQSDTIIIPESGNGIPDILDEARWGLVWLMKMQQSDGSVYHKVDSEPNFGWGNAPEDDQLTRTVKFQSKDISSPSTVDAGVFCGVMALGYIMYKTIEPSFADSCRLHAMTSWEWLKENKEDIQEDPYYMDKNVRDELAWAAAGIYTLTEDTTALSELNSYLLSSGINVVNWNNPSLFGFLEVYFSEIASDELKTSIRNAIIQKADNLKSHIYNDAYMSAAPDYWWDSNNYILGAGQLLLIAYLLTDDIVYRNVALSQLHYVLGHNALSFSFVTDNGTSFCKRPWHWTKKVYDVLMPGWIAGGANRYPDGADDPLISLQEKGYPPSKCYIDDCESGSWASNEGTIDKNAALIFLSGFFTHPRASNIISIPLYGNSKINCSLNIRFYQSANKIIITGKSRSMQWSLYSVSGKLMTTGNSNIIPLNIFPRGVYLLHIQGMNLKVIKF